MANVTDNQPLTNDEKRARLAGGLGRGAKAPAAADAQGASAPDAAAGAPAPGAAPVRRMSQLANETVDRKLLVRGIALCAVVVVAAVILIVVLAAGVQS
ncbi:MULTISPECIES: hypothetical protein [unclassified Adlercreutzia]|uniref:hypothetical protein n=1 Tax=unclassified Adlercreutzia TaxID=2636013 RepID=UPI00197E5012|nr:MULTISPECIES: hypothetical protein [unclassified Adlercreutzia]